MGIAQIPFASFIRINKYSYDEGMDKVGKQQNDVLGSLQNSGLLKNVTGGLSDTAQWAYGDKTGGNEYLALEEKDALPELKKKRKIDINQLVLLQETGKIVEAMKIY